MDTIKQYKHLLLIVVLLLVPTLLTSLHVIDFKQYAHILSILFIIYCAMLAIHFFKNKNYFRFLVTLALIVFDLGALIFSII